MTKAGNRPILDREGSYGLHKESGIKTPIREEKGVAVMRARLRGSRAIKDQGVRKVNKKPSPMEMMDMI